MPLAGRTTEALPLSIPKTIYDDTLAGGFATGRLAEQRFYPDETAYDDGAGTPAEVWSYTYDAYGREVEVQQDDGTIRTVKTSYDAEGRIIEVDAPEGVITYAYNPLGRKVSTSVFPAGADTSTATAERVTSYDYDLLGRLKSVREDLDPASTSDTPLDTEYAYDLVGNLDRTDLPNGVVTDYVFDELNRLEEMTHFAPDGTPADLSDNQPLARFQYTLRADGKRTAATETFWLDADTDPGTPLTQHVNQIDWTYDAVGRLVEEAFDHFDNSLDQTDIFVYDLASNRRSLTTDNGNDALIDEAITYLYDANDRLIDELLDSDNNGTTDQTTTYGWDHTQQTSKTVVDQATSQTTSEVSFAYDLQGRMAQVKTEAFSGGALTSRERVTYDYDATGIRISSLLETDSVLDPNTDNWTFSGRTEFLVDHQNFTGYQQAIKETTFDSLGNITETIEYTFGHDEIAQTVTPYVSGSPDTANVQTHVFGHDGHGSVRVLFDMTAAVVQLYAFEAYGQLLSIHNGAAQFVSADAADALTSHLHSGEHFDAKITLQYLRGRWLDHATGRLNPLDPFGGNMQDPLSVHKYLFVHADPVQGVDPTGEFGVAASLAGSTIGATLNKLTFEAGNSVLAFLGADTTVLDPTLFALSWVWKHLPQSWQDAISGFLNTVAGLVLAHSNKAVALVALGVVIGQRRPRKIVGTKIFRHQRQIRQATFSLSRKRLTKQVQTRAKQIAATFKDPDTKKLISFREALSISRWQTLADDAVQESNERGVDFISQLLGKVSLKGPAVQGDGSRFTPRQVQDLIDAAIRDANGHTQGVDALVLDMMGASKADIAAARHQLRSTQVQVPIYILE